MDNSDFRPNVSIILLNSRGDIFLGERSDEPGHWQFPQGGLEADSSLEENAFRELQEEAGIARTSCSLVGPLEFVNVYRWSPEKQYGRWRGQAQRFVVIRFVGHDSEIRLDADDHIEFRAWRWCPQAEVLEQVAPVRRPGYELALMELSQRFSL